MITFERFEALLKAARELADTAPKTVGRERWRRFELALMQAEATGARTCAVRGLRWSDVQQVPAAIRWRAELDKRGRERVVPIPADLAATLRRFQKDLGGIGEDWLFPRADRSAPWPTPVFGELYCRAEAKAGLPHLEGGRWHPFRRKWATERRGMPLVDVAAAGGWRDLKTLTTCYQQTDADGMLRVMACPAKLRQAQAGS